MIDCSLLSKLYVSKRLPWLEDTALAVTYYYVEEKGIKDEEKRAMYLRAIRRIITPVYSNGGSAEDIVKECQEYNSRRKVEDEGVGVANG